MDKEQEPGVTIAELREALASAGLGISLTPGKWWCVCDERFVEKCCSLKDCKAAVEVDAFGPGGLTSGANK